MKHKKVSVIVPVFNLDNYVKDCIDGLLQQKTNFEYEIIVIDDCSTDNSWAILQSLQQHHPNKLSCYQNKTNQGLAKTIQLLMMHVKGEYIAYLDGDDIALAGKLQKQVDYLDQHQQCAMVYHEMDVFDSETNNSLWRYVKDYYNRDYIPLHASAEHLIKYGCFMHICSTMIRNHANLLKTADQVNKIILDHPWLLLNQLYLKGYIDYIGETLGRYRIHSTSFGAKNRAVDSRRLQVLNEQLHVCDLATPFRIENSIIMQGKRHYYYATALFFLKKNKIDLFNANLNKSTDGQLFLDEKHQDIWLNRENLKYLKNKYFC